MANLDYTFAVREMQAAKGGRLDQVYEIEDNVFRFRLANKGERTEVIAVLGTRLSPTKIIPESPLSPTSFASLLRKRLSNAVIEEIRQVSGDRLVMMRLRKEDTHGLYFEMFAKGNLVLCDEGGKVVAAYREQKEGKRIVARNGQYPVPPEQADPVDAGATKKVFAAAETIKDAGKKIALSPQYFDDFLKGPGISGAAPDAVANKLAEYASKAEFTVYYGENAVPIGFSSVRLNAPAGFLKEEPKESKIFAKFSDALDEYYSKAAENAPKKKAGNAKLEKLLRQKDLQEKSVAEMTGAADELKAVGDAIYLNYDKVELALEKAKKEKKEKTEIEV